MNKSGSNAHFVSGSCSRRDPLDSSHSAHLRLPRAAQEILWHPHRLLSCLSALLQPIAGLHHQSRPHNLKAKKGRKET